MFGPSSTIAPTSGEETIIQNVTISIPGSITPGASMGHDYCIYNIGEYTAYLNSIVFEDITPTCTPGEGTNPDLVEAACDGYYVEVEIIENDLSSGDIYHDTTTGIDGKSLAKSVPGQAGVKYVASVNIGSVSGTQRADGPFTVSFGDIKLVYGSSD